MAITLSRPETVEQSRIAGWLTPDEFAVLEEICETLLPTLEPPAGSSGEKSAYYRRRASDLRVAQQIAEMLGRENPDVHANLRLWLTLFTTPLFGLLFTGSAQPFVKLPQEKREQFLLALANNPVGPFRQGFQGIKRLAGLIYFSTLDEQGNNPNWPVLGYTPPVAQSSRAAAPITPLEIVQDSVLEADVVVIGSGAGGGVIAGELARSGKSVIVLEKGGYNHEGNFTLRESQAMSELFLKRGALSTKDLGLIMMAGSTLGGGTVVNWMTSFRTPDDILAEWEQHSGLRDCFTGTQLQESFAVVERRINVNSEHSQHNQQNQRLFDGATRLGYHADVVRRNVQGCEQRCGACNFGCSNGCSQSTMKTYLQDAYERGTRIIIRCSADKVLIENGQVKGVKASVQDEQTGQIYQLTVHARSVVVAAGALHSPAILRRSGLENQHIGRHLHLHPSAISVGVYPEKVHAWQGVLQSAYSGQFTHLDGNYGYTLETAPAHPGLFGLATPWYSARNYRDEMTTIEYLSSIIVLTRDKGEGRVTLDHAGEPQVEYRVNAYDRQHILHGLHQGTRVHLSAGAERVISLQNRSTDLRRSTDGTVGEQQLRAFDRQIERRGLGSNRIILFTAHQMGTCRMGAHPSTSVTDNNQQVHGVKGLFVCDSSVFPSACGVNPMLSIMALAHRASRGIKDQL